MCSLNKENSPSLSGSAGEVLEKCSGLEACQACVLGSARKVLGVAPGFVRVVHFCVVSARGFLGVLVQCSKSARKVLGKCRVLE